MAQDMAPRTPKVRHGLANSNIIGRRICIYIAGIGQFAARGTVDAMYLRMRKGLQGRNAQFLCQSVYTSMFEELFASIICSISGLWL